MLTHLQALLDRLQSHSLELHHIVQMAQECGISIVTLCDDLSVLVARSYGSGEMDHEEGGRIMNSLFSLAATPQFWELSGGNVPPLVMAIYQAFDEGEYVHPADAEHECPEEKCTRPMITAILAQFAAASTPAFERTAFAGAQFGSDVST